MDGIRLVPADELGLRPRIGLAKIAKRAFDGEDLNPLWETLVKRLKADASDTDAAMDLSLVAQFAGKPELGLQIQAEALAGQRLYRAPCPRKPVLRVLAFMAEGAVGDNVPIEFLIADSGVELYTLYVAPGRALPEILPDHDVAFVAAPESEASHAALAEIARLAARWPRPVVNMPTLIPWLDRDRFCKLLGDVPGIAIPATVRIDRDDLQDIASGSAGIAEFLADGRFPLIVRPVDSQAGRGLARLEGPDGIAEYLEDNAREEFFLSNFIDYAGQDGLFRKYRIVFIAGRAYACHMAIGEEWKMWYLNAGMDVSIAKRAEEERFMARFDEDFAARHARALSAIAARVGLDYFGIDCAELADGRLLIFEGDIAMIVHDMDPPETFPYKHPQMQKVFAAFRAMLAARARLAQAA